MEKRILSIPMEKQSWSGFELRGPTEELDKTRQGEGEGERGRERERERERERNH